MLDLNCLNVMKSESIKFIGPGVERVAEELTKLFPKNCVSIMSSDNVNSPKK